MVQRYKQFWILGCSVLLFLVERGNPYTTLGILPCGIGVFISGREGLHLHGESPRVAPEGCCQGGARKGCHQHAVEPPHTRTDGHLRRPYDITSPHQALHGVTAIPYIYKESPACISAGRGYNLSEICCIKASFQASQRLW